VQLVEVTISNSNHSKLDLSLTKLTSYAKRVLKSLLFQNHSTCILIKELLREARVNREIMKLHKIQLAVLILMQIVNLGKV
jgi:hypothetical protein